MAPVLAILTEVRFEGRMVTISAVHSGSSTSPRASIGWPKAVMRCPSMREMVPVPAIVMSPVAKATATAEPARNGAGGVLVPGAEAMARVLPPSAVVLSPKAAK